MTAVSLDTIKRLSCLLTFFFFKAHQLMEHHLQCSLPVYIGRKLESHGKKLWLVPKYVCTVVHLQPQFTLGVGVALHTNRWTFSAFDAVTVVTVGREQNGTYITFQVVPILLTFTYIPFVRISFCNCFMLSPCSSFRQKQRPYKSLRQLVFAP